MKLLIPGQRDAVDRGATRGPAAAGVSKPATPLLDDVEVVASFSLTPSARARTPVRQEFETRDGDILEIEVEGGFKLWTSPERYREEVARLRPQSALDDGVVVDTRPPASTSQRGVRAG